MSAPSDRALATKPDDDRPGVARAWTVAVLASAAAMVALAMMRAGGDLLAGDPAPLYAALDFNAALFEDLLGPYWRTAAAILDGEVTPDRQYLYPATLAILLAPLTALGEAAATAAAVLSGAITLGALLAAALLASPARGLRSAAALGAAAGAAYPVLHGIYWANAGAPCVALALLGWVLASRDRGRTGGVLIGLAAAVKLTPLLLLLGLAVCGRDRALRWGAGTFVLLAIGLPLVVLGPGGFGDFHGATREQLHALVELTSTPEGARGAQDLRSAGIRLGLGGWSWILAVLGAAAWLRCAARDVRAGDDRGALWLLLLPCLLVRPCWAHGLVWLPVAWWLARDGAPRTRALIGLSAAVASFPASWAFPTPTEFLRAGMPLTAAGLAALALFLERNSGPDPAADAPSA